MAKVFHALDRNESEPSGEIFDVLTGVGGLTEARTSKIYQRDWEDIWRSWGSGEPAWFGGRKVENRCVESETFDNASWLDVGLKGDIVANATIAPDGTITADRLVDDASGGTGIVLILQSITVGLITVHALSIYLKSGGNTWVQVKASDQGALAISAFFDLTNGVVGATTGSDNISEFIEDARETFPNAPDGWFRCGIVFTSDVADTEMSFEIRVADDDNDTTVDTSSGTSSIFVWGAQLENVSGQADTSPSEYVPTTTAAAHKIFGTDRSGVPFASLPWLYGGPAGTNEITQSFDLADAAWTKINGVINSFDQVGLTGVANTATYLEDDDGSTHEFVREDIIIANDTNTHTIRCFILKDADETRFPMVGLELASGNAFYHINTKTGATGIDSDTATNAAVEVNDVGLWWEVLVSAQNSGVTSGTYVIPARATVLGTANVAATGSIIVGNVELHLNKTIAQVRGSTPIFTSGSTVTVDATDLSFDDANHDDLEGAYFCEFKNVGVTSETAALVSLSSNRSPMFAQASNGIDSFDGSVQASGPVITLAADDTEYKIGTAYGSSLHRTNTDGSFGAEVAYDGSFNKTFFEVLSNSGGGALVTVMLLRNLRRYDLPYDAAQDAIDDMMNGIFPEIKLPRLLTVRDTLQYKPLRYRRQ